jgi:hypothetical protein
MKSLRLDEKNKVIAATAVNPMDANSKLAAVSVTATPRQVRVQRPQWPTLKASATQRRLAGPCMLACWHSAAISHA